MLKWTSLAASTVLLVLAGCGGGGSESSASEESTSEPTTTTQAQTTTETVRDTITHDDFVAKLDAWCKRGNAEQEQRIGSKFDDAQAANDYEAAADALQIRQDLAAQQEEHLPVKEEELSTQDAHDFRRYRLLSNRLDGVIDRLIAALRAKDDDEITRLSGLVTPTQNQRTNLAVDMGLSECGS